MRRTAALVAASLVPVLVLAGTQAAHAATNLNAWHTTTVTKHAPVEQADFLDSADCSITSRYSANGYGVEWSNSECLGSFDATPGSAQFAEPGSIISLIFRGTYDGAAAPANYTESKHNNNLVALDAGSSTCITKVCTSGTVVWKNVSGAPMTAAIVFGVACWNGVTPPTATDASWANWNGGTFSMGQNQRKADGSYVNPWPAGTLSYTPYSCPAGQTLYAVAGGINAAPTQANIYTIQQVVGPGVPVEGEGAGNACEVESGQLTLLDHPGANSWSGVAGLIPNGSAVFDPTYGHCLPDQVCVHYVKEGWGQDVDAEYCGEADWGNPAAIPSSGDSSPEPVAPPATGQDNPDAPTTETGEDGFWASILGALASGFKAVVRALGAVVRAVGAIATTILDGLGALFIPSPSSWDTQGLLDQLNSRPPFSVVGDLGTTVSATADSYSSGSGCGSIADFHAPGGGGEITCSSMKSTPGFGTLFTLVQVGLWAMTGFAVFNLFASRAKAGDGA